MEKKMKNEIGLEKLAELARDEMVEDLGLRMSIDVGDAFFNALFYGTLKTFPERVDSSGFCHTSYGEVNDVKLYRWGHYPRDAAEAARVLACCGFVDHAIRILEFNIRNTPENQHYIPHILRFDGSIKANTVQVDTPAYQVLALQRCVELSGPSERLRLLYARIKQIMESTWDCHFHKDWQLLDAGNYNEAVQGTEVTCDLITNSINANAYAALGYLCRVFNEEELAEKYAMRKKILESGIENILYDPDEKIYRVKRDIKTGKYGSYINWINIYPQRYYPGNPQTWDNAFEILKQTTTINWDSMEVICEYPERDGLIGQGFAHLLSYLGQTGRFALLQRHMDFARQTIRKPVNIYPEGWKYKDPDEPTQYEKNFSAKYGDTWQAYMTNPEGDYTVDSGNCEQCAVFLFIFINDLLGVNVMSEGVHLWPKLPFGFENIKINNVPVRKKQECLTRISYEMERKNNQVDMTITTDDRLARVTLSVPVNASHLKVKINGVLCEKYETSEVNDVNWISVAPNLDGNNKTTKYQIKITHD
jgi:hypothetical protein